MRVRHVDGEGDARAGADRFDHRARARQDHRGRPHHLGKLAAI
jgi:hypothetical protein